MESRIKLLEEEWKILIRPKLHDLSNESIEFRVKIDDIRSDIESIKEELIDQRKQTNKNSSTNWQTILTIFTTIITILLTLISLSKK